MPPDQKVFYFEFPLKIGWREEGYRLMFPKLDGWAGECAAEVSATMCGATSADN